jgi:Holliday junction resolvase RusA-like endonuclease
MTKILIFVQDTPRPGGSKRAFSHKGRAWVVDANEHTSTWRNSVRAAALSVYRGRPLHQAVRVKYIFYFNRPRCHFGSGKNSQILKPSAPEHHTKKPDLTKLERSTEDALTGIIWKDDCQVVKCEKEKKYCEEWETEGCQIEIEVIID